MPAVKRKAAASSSAANKSTRHSRPSAARAPKLAQQLDMYIRRSDDESDDDAPPAVQQTNGKTKGKGAVEYEPESDEASDVASDDDVDVKTVSASNLAFLQGLDSNKAINVSQKDAKQKAKELKRSDRKAFDDERRRVTAEKKARLTQPPSDDDDEEFDSDLMDDSEDEPEKVVEKKNYQEYSDVSEGEEVVSEDEAPKRPTKSHEADEDAEAAYMARLGKRKQREQHEREQERKLRVNAKLPVRKLDGDLSDDSDSEPQDRQDSEPEGLGSDVESESDDERAQKSRAVHAPIPRAASPSDEEAAPSTSTPVVHSSITHSARFNLTAPYEILLASHACRLPPAPASRKAASAHRAAVAAAHKHTLLLARNQIASLASQIIADPEVNLGLLRRLAVFAGATISAPPEKIPEIRAEQAAARAAGDRSTARPVKIEVPPAIRQLAMVSLLAVFVDILPGYRIRSLTEKEQDDKVGQEIARRREYEAGLVAVYRDFLELCEAELKAANAGPEDKIKPGVGKLEGAAIRVFSTLAVRAVHFNFRQNILGVVVARMSRRQWGEEEVACYEAIKTVVLGDLTGEVSLEVVRLIHRMTKERRFKVNSRVLDVLLHLRLRDELGSKRSSTTNATDPEKDAARAFKEAEERRAAMKAREKRGKGGKAKAREVRKGAAVHLSKKQVKKQKELRAIEDEMKEAEATVDLELRERNQTETLKLVFVLYFTLLKAPVGSVAAGVLESGMRGLSMYAHRVNVDFFRDLLKVLKVHVATNAALLTTTNDDSDSDSDDENILLDQSVLTRVIRQIIVALKTTFDLFLNQAQGTILNLDLTDMLSHLYYVLFFLPFTSGDATDLALDTIYSILVRSASDQHVQAAFAKRLSIVALQMPAQTAKKTLGIVGHLIAKNTANAALLDLDDQSRNGTYNAEGANLASTGVLESGQTVLWELAHLTKQSNQELAQKASDVWALKDAI